MFNERMDPLGEPSVYKLFKHIHIKYLASDNLVSINISISHRTSLVSIFNKNRWTINTNKYIKKNIYVIRVYIYNAHN